MSRIFNGDCMEIMRNLIKENVLVDAIITDPPYNISKDNQFHTLKNAKRQGVDFGEWDKNFDLFSWLDIADILLKKNGSIIIFNSFLHIGNIAKYLENKGYAIKDLIRWEKNNPMPRNMNRRYVSDYELAIWCVKLKGTAKDDRKWIFNNENTGYLRPKFEIPLVSKKEKVEHPTQKPLKLMESIIKIHTDKSDLILDPFMGSGSTGVASLNLQRDFIGIELEKEYFNISQNRINKITDFT